MKGRIMNREEGVTVLHAESNEKYVPVALVKVPKYMTTEEKLNFAYMKTNSIDDAWWNNEEVDKLFNGAACRSTYLGDMLLVDGEKYLCKKVGWDSL